MEPRSGCPINAAVELLGDRWSWLVLRDVIVQDRRPGPARSPKGPFSTVSSVAPAQAAGASFRTGAPID